MSDTKTVENNKPDILANISDPLSLKGLTEKPRLRKRRSYKRAESKIEPRIINGQLYYYYRRGRDPRIYLGNADSILWKIKHVKG